MNLIVDKLTSYLCTGTKKVKVLHFFKSGNGICKLPDERKRDFLIIRSIPEASTGFAVKIFTGI
jgi:hypothetical protein